MEYSIKGDLIAIELSLLETDEEFTEDVGIYDTSNRFKIFCKKILNYMKEFIAKLKIDIESTKEKHGQKKALQTMRANIVSGKITGPVEFIDIRAINNLFRRKVKSLEKGLDRISNVKCRNQGDLDHLDIQINAFYRDLDRFEHDLDIVLNKKIRLSGDAAVNFIDNCLRGRDVTYNAYSDMINQMQKFQVTCQRKLDNKLMSAGLKATYFRKYENVISSFSNRISKSVRKTWVATVFLVS